MKKEEKAQVLNGFAYITKFEKYVKNT